MLKFMETKMTLATSPGVSFNSKVEFVGFFLRRLALGEPFTICRSAYLSTSNQWARRILIACQLC